MQVLKEEVRRRIMKAAEKEFQKSGFERTSMRTISKNADMSVGNLYRYYKGKDELFGTIVDKLAVELEKMLANTPDDPESSIGYLFDNIKALQEDYSAEWLVLFGGSTGTKYSKLANKTHQTLQNSIAGIFQKKGMNPELAGPSAAAMIVAINDIFQSEKSTKKACRLTNEFLDYMFFKFSHGVA